MNDETTMIRLEQPHTSRFAVCVLAYGDHTDLAKRCLSSITALPDIKDIELRIGMNECGKETQQFIGEIFKQETDKGRHVLLYKANINRGKYPMMRWMCHDPVNPIRSPYIMWFDDDSYITTPNTAWLNAVETTMTDVDMCGAVMRCDLTGNQRIWIQVQPWYNGKLPTAMYPTGRSVIKSTSPPPILKYLVPSFAVGGWWVARTSMFNKLAWPPVNIIHRGGDVMLGEAMRQHDFKLAEFTNGVAINADGDSNNHKAKRRGISPLSVGIAYDPPVTVLIHEISKSIDPKLLDYPGL